MPPKQSKNQLHELHVHVEVPIPVCVTQIREHARRMAGGCHHKRGDMVI